MSQEIDLTPEAAALLKSPLHSAAPESLDELFSRDPLELTDQNLDQIVSHLRAQRHQWAQEEATGAKKSKAKQIKPKERVKIEDLNLNLNLNI